MAGRFADAGRRLGECYAAEHISEHVVKGGGRGSPQVKLQRREKLEFDVPRSMEVADGEETRQESNTKVTRSLTTITWEQTTTITLPLQKKQWRRGFRSRTPTPSPSHGRGRSGPPALKDVRGAASTGCRKRRGCISRGAGSANPSSAATSIAGSAVSEEFCGEESELFGSEVCSDDDASRTMVATG